MRRYRSDFSEDQLEVLASCPWCQGTAFTTLFEERGFAYDQCDSCTLILLQPRPKEEFVSLLYDDASYHPDAPDAYTTDVAEHRLALLGDVPPTHRILEDGAGTGAFVDACRRRGLDATGCDLGLDAVHKAKEFYGVELAHGTLDQLGIAPASLDVIAGFNLLGHLYHPWQYMEVVAGLLKPGGRWLLRTNDASGRMATVRKGHWGAPEHPFHYTGAVLTQMASKAGLTVEWIKPAFDCEYPYVLYDFSLGGTSRLRRAVRIARSYSVVLWSRLGLPKDDVYVLLKKA